MTHTGGIPKWSHSKYRSTDPPVGAQKLFSQLTYPAEARLRLVLSQEFLRTRVEEEDEGGSGEEPPAAVRADEAEWRLSKSAISLQNGRTHAAASQMP